MNNKILEVIERELEIHLNLFLKKKISEEELLKNLNQASFYNSFFQDYIYYMFFKVAVEKRKIPKSKALISLLFKDLDPEFCVSEYTLKKKSIRLLVLKHLNLKESFDLYENYVLHHKIKIYPETYTEFEGGIKNKRYLKFKDSNVTATQIKEKILDELHE